MGPDPRARAVTRERERERERRRPRRSFGVVRSSIEGVDARRRRDDGKEDDGKGKGKMITGGGDGGVGLSRDARETNARC